MTELRPIRSEADYEAVAEIERLWGRKSGTPEGAGAEWRSEQVPELFDGQARIPHDSAEGVRVYGVVARDRQNADAIGHDDVFGLPRDPEAGLTQLPEALGDDAGFIDHGRLGDLHHEHG